MNHDNRRKNATKHYQNSDYPSGSFEAAITADQNDWLSEPQGLRLERHPLAPGNSGADLEEMVPAFMHRDFFRSEEDAIEPIAPNSRLRTPRKPAAVESYQEPPNTEESGVPPTPRSPYAPPRDGAPAVVTPRQADGAASVPVPPLKTVEEPLSRLRTGDTPPAPELRTLAKPERPVAETYPPTVVEPGSHPAASKSPYSMPLLVAIALVMGVFVWREQTRPTVVAQEPLAVPKAVQATPSASPMPEPTPAGVGFRPTYVAVGPPVPENEVSPVGTSPSPAPSGEPGSLMPGQVGEAASGPAGDDGNADERAAILERMSHASGSSSASSAPAGEPGELFPTEESDAPDAPPAPKAPVRQAGSKVEAAPKAAPVAKAEPKAVPVSATSADLFPIDEEVPIKPGRGGPPAVAAPAPAQQSSSAPAGSASSDGYQIDEPNL